MSEIKYKTWKYNEYRPTEKQNCICWTKNGEKITAYYHQLKGCMIGLYPPHQNKRIEEVEDWCYAILCKRTSNDLFPDMVDQLGLRDGKEVFRTQYSCLGDEQQERLFREVEAIEFTIKRFFEECKND